MSPTPFRYLDVMGQRVAVQSALWTVLQRIGMSEELRSRADRKEGADRTLSEGVEIELDVIDKETVKGCDCDGDRREASGRTQSRTGGLVAK